MCHAIFISGGGGNSVLMKTNRVLMGATAILIVILFIGVAMQPVNNQINNGLSPHNYGRNGSLCYIAGKHHLNLVNSMSNNTKIKNDAPFLAGSNVSNEAMNITWDSYNSSSANVHGLAVTITMNGKLFHQAIMINSTNNMTLIPIYSSSGNYKILSTSFNNSSSQKTNSNVGPSLYIDMTAYLLSNGIGFNQQMFDTFMTGFAFTGIIESALSGPAAGFVGAAFLLGGAIFTWYDEMGGQNGISFTTYTIGIGWFSYTGTQINAPFDPYGSNVEGIITLYQGNI